MRESQRGMWFAFSLGAIAFCRCKIGLSYSLIGIKGPAQARGWIIVGVPMNMNAFIFSLLSRVGLGGGRTVFQWFTKTVQLLEAKNMMYTRDMRTQGTEEMLEFQVAIMWIKRRQRRLFSINVSSNGNDGSSPRRVKMEAGWSSTSCVIKADCKKFWETGVSEDKDYWVGNNTLHVAYFTIVKGKLQAQSRAHKLLQDVDGNLEPLPLVTSLHGTGRYSAYHQWRSVDTSWAVSPTWSTVVTCLQGMLAQWWHKSHGSNQPLSNLT